MFTKPGNYRAPGYYFSAPKPPFCSLFLFLNNIIYLLLAVLGLHSCRLFSSYSKRRLVSVTAHRLLIAVASLVVEKVPGSWVSIAVAHRLSCSVARGMFLDQRLNPCPLRWQADSYPLHHQGSPVVCFVTMKPEFCKPHFCFASNSMLSLANGDTKERLES